jgi:glycosyltransferase involved in cell wall biosynthesis
MHILMVHNYYQQRGGEDESTENEIRLLEKNGHSVRFYSRHNNEIKTFTLWRKFKLFAEPTWSRRTFREISKIIGKFGPDIVHVQNFFPLISPAVFYASDLSGIPVVCSLRNYRLLCPGAFFFRNGKICEECVETDLRKSLRHGCYRSSRIQTASVLCMLVAHRLAKTLEHKITLFTALTNFSRDKMVAGGLPRERIVVHPNFLTQDPSVGRGPRRGFVFAGRLSEEKGVRTLLEAWTRLPEIPLTIIGEGPLRIWAENFIRENGLVHVRMTGHLNTDEVLAEIKRSIALVSPSLWYETFGRNIIEAYATGTPVIASRLGAMAELVVEGETGMFFAAGEAEDLAEKVRTFLSRRDIDLNMGANARRVFETKFSAEQAHVSLLKIYEQALAMKKMGEPKRVQA